MRWLKTSRCTQMNLILQEQLIRRIRHRLRLGQTCQRVCMEPMSSPSSLMTWVFLTQVVLAAHSTLPTSIVSRKTVCATPVFTQQRCARLHVQVCSQVAIIMRLECAACPTGIQVSQICAEALRLRPPRWLKFYDLRVMQRCVRASGTLHQWKSALQQAHTPTGHCKKALIASMAF